MNADKEKLRVKYKAIRLGMSRNNVRLKSRMVCRKLINGVDWTEIKTVLIYEPITKLNEVELNEFLDKVKNVEIEVLNTTPTQPLPSRKYDLIIVPTLAFDKDNYRLGWGGGFYDRLLASQPQAQKIGLCFQSGFIKGGIPHEPHDIRLDKIFTEV